MADVTSLLADDGRRSRGQLILVGGLIVAIGLVALVLLLNTVLFAENIATRGINPGGERAHDHATFAEHAGATVLRAGDRPTTEPTDWSTARDNITAGMERVAALSRNRSLQHHRAYTNISVNRTTRGAALIQNASRNFTDVDGSDDWTLATTNGSRRFTMTVNASAMSASDNFTVEIADTPWQANVNGTAGEGVQVSVYGTTCNTTASLATINWTAGTLGGCSFPFAVDSSGDPLDQPLEIRIANGSQGHGTYFLVVEDEGGNSVDDSNFAALGADQSPRQYPVVYSLFLDVRYEDLDVTYETTVRTAPGEPTQTRPKP